jgi:phosphonate transport system permease protein
MAVRALPRPRLGYVSTSALLLIVALLSLSIADIAVTVLDPWAEFRRLLTGLMSADITAIEARGIALTVAFAVIGVGIGASVGIALALVFPYSRSVRLVCAFLRSIHEMFWALLLINITGLSPTTGILAIALPYSGIFAKVFAEMIEEADLGAVRALPTGTSKISAFAFARVPDLAEQFKSYALYRLECGLRSTLVLGFIGLPTIGFQLESYFRQGHYAQAFGLLASFYVLIGTRRLWARTATLPFLLAGSIAALALLADRFDNGSTLANLMRFASEITPRPLRDAALFDGGIWAHFAGWLWPIIRLQILPGVVQTLVLAQIAMVGMALLALASFPLICERFAGRLGKPLGRIVLVIVRSTPEYMLAYMLLQLLGPSMLPAIIALAFHNGAIVGYLMGRHADVLTYRADAPSGMDLYVYETVPRLYGQFLAYVLYRWEIILRESAIFGILGIATLGFYVDAAISELKLDVAMVLIVATALLSMTVDAVSRGLRRRLRIDAMPTRLAAAPVEAT